MLEIVVKLIAGIGFVAFGIFTIVTATKGHESDRNWGWGVFLGDLLIVCGIYFVGSFGCSLGRQMDPPLPVTKQGHVYEVLNSMEFKKGYLVSFQKIVPSKKDAQVRFFETVPPRLFESVWENDKQIYVPFELPTPNPVK